MGNQPPVPATRASLRASGPGPSTSARHQRRSNSNNNNTTSSSSRTAATGGRSSSSAANSNNLSSSSPGGANDETVSGSVFTVINSGDARQLEFLLNSLRNYDVNRPGPAGNPPLHAAVHGTVNTLEVVKLLERKGANLNGLNADGETPLIIATSADREDVVKLLLDLGADVDVPSATGAPPLYYALAKRCRAVLPAIVVRKPNVNFVTQDSESILHAAVRFCDLEVIHAVVNHLRVYQGGRVQLPPLLPSVMEKLVTSSSSVVSRDDEDSSPRHQNQNDDDDEKREDGISSNPHINQLMMMRSPNSFADDDSNYRRWANTASLLDAKSTHPSAPNVCPIGMAIHNAINPANSVNVGTKSSQCAHYLACIRTDMMLEEYLDIPRSSTG